MKPFGLSLFVLAIGCSAPPTPPEQPSVVTRPLGSWQGRGSQTIGVVSESGRLRIIWETRNERSPGSGTFKLALHSAVSGRPIQLIADVRGERQGSADVTEHPRPYNLMVDSANLDWSFSVEEIVAGPAKPQAARPSS